MEKVLILRKDFSGTKYYLDWKRSSIQPRASVTKLLGGKDMVNRSKWYCYKSLGGWITEWTIKTSDLNKATESANKYGYKLVIKED